MKVQRRPLPWPRMALVAAGIGLAGAAGSLLPARWHAVEIHGLDASLPLLLSATALLLVVWTADQAWRSRGPQRLPVVGSEEPLLSSARLAAGRHQGRIVLVAGVEPGSGASTVTFNLAVSLTAQGFTAVDEETRRVRPACVLAEGALSAALGLSPDRLEEHIGGRLPRVKPEVVNLSVRHASGCELFCLRQGVEGRDRMAALLPELRRRYDVVFVDARLPRVDLGHLAAQMSDLLLLVALSRPSAVEAVGPWIEMVWGMGIEERTGLVLNCVTAWPPPPQHLRLAFLQHTELPEERDIPDMDRRGLPWSQEGHLGAARRLAAVVRDLFPSMVPMEVTDAA